MVRAVLPLLALASTVLSWPLDPHERVSCVSGLYILVARGSNQDAGEGSSAQVADMIEARIPNSISQAIDYPATIIDFGSNYISSVNDGINDTKEKIESYVAACGAASRIVLLGYSQGGNVMTDTLAGGTFRPRPLEQRFSQYVEAVAVFGDPRFNAGQIYSAGNSTRNGIFARRGSLAGLEPFGGIVRSYCDLGDPFCASGGNFNVHSATVGKYAQAATDFVVGITA